MNRLSVEKKLEDLTYRMNIEKTAINRAEYNIKFAELLYLSDEAISTEKSIIDTYATKYAKNKQTYDVLAEYLDTTCESPYGEQDMLFKCTFPAESGYINGKYQTSIVCKESVAKLFANGVNYKDIIACLDDTDITAVDTKFDIQTSKNILNGNVDVELAQEADFATALDVPLTTKEDNCIVASGKIQYCVPFDDHKVYDFAGNEYNVPVPTFEDITFLQTMTQEKFSDLQSKVELEQVVKYKMDTAINRMNLVLDDMEKYNER